MERHRCRTARTWIEELMAAGAKHESPPIRRTILVDLTEGIGTGKAVEMSHMGNSQVNQLPHR